MAKAKNPENNSSTVSASISLDGEGKAKFDTIRNHMKEMLPGINPNNADVMRYALNLANDVVANVSTPGTE